jgi:hypothetical protein
VHGVGHELLGDGALDAPRQVGVAAGGLQHDVVVVLVAAGAGALVGVACSAR